MYMSPLAVIRYVFRSFPDAVPLIIIDSIALLTINAVAEIRLCDLLISVVAAQVDASIRRILIDLG